MTGTPRKDDDLRSAMRHAVSDVQPRRGLEEIESRLEDERSSSGRMAGTVAAVAATVLVIGGVAWLNHEAKKPEPAPAAGRDVTVQAFYLGPTAGGDRLFSERHDLQDVTGTDVAAAVSAALGAPDDPDYHSPFPKGTTASIEGGTDVITVDLELGHTPLPRLKDHDAEEAIQTVVWTVNAAAQRPVQVLFEVDGQPADELFGKVVNGPVSEQSADTVLSPVSIDLAEGADIASGTTIIGHAATFEANVVWELRQGEQVVKQGFTTAGECCTLSPYAFRLSAPPGSYTLVVHDTDESGLHHPVTSDSKDIVIR